MHPDPHNPLRPTAHRLPNGPLTLTATDGAQISVSLHGGHVCSWRTADGVERLFLSPLTDWHSTAAIRGGIPVIFPQFASRGPLQKHGFARLSMWTLIAATVRRNGEGFVHLTLRDSAESRLQFPHAFTLDLLITFSGSVLNTELVATNTDAQAFDFTCALHTYLSTAIAQSTIHGLHECRYQNSVAGSRLNIDRKGRLHIDGEVDSIFFQAMHPVELVTDDAAVMVHKTGFPDIVVWNPWVSASIADLENDAYQHFICIESAAIEHPITLTAGMQWRGQQQLVAGKSSATGLVKPPVHHRKSA
jgi:glucose-6-phosphate 1-epimerase